MLGKIVNTLLWASEKPFSVQLTQCQRLLSTSASLPVCVFLMHTSPDSTTAQQSFMNGFTKVTTTLKTKWLWHHWVLGVLLP
ncbi:hypothetical protein L873DRAFT_1045855 [Choiromyces venosus 120613-1]|uniref:Uncharacterized protein n=1 Tax=Choiromyces venosus 120613-1 TaxID=1336337 RepID=A0A3N4JN81_9PEZI|nr:hypothetical protein L873DRAFT_1045855 [Choiromyces venosus 120613-1]